MAVEGRCSVRRNEHLLRIIITLGHDIYFIAQDTGSNNENRQDFQSNSNAYYNYNATRRLTLVEAGAKAEAEAAKARTAAAEIFMVMSSRA